MKILHYIIVVEFYPNTVASRDVPGRFQVMSKGSQYKFFPIENKYIPLR